jgi:hypothetical protein
MSHIKLSLTLNDKNENKNVLKFTVYNDTEEVYNCFVVLDNESKDDNIIFSVLCHDKAIELLKDFFIHYLTSKEIKMKHKEREKKEHKSKMPMKKEKGSYEEPMRPKKPNITEKKKMK